jgi:hypothetical protein
MGLVKLFREKTFGEYIEDESHLLIGTGKNI